MSRKIQLSIKRIFDIFISIIFILLFLPILLLIAFSIKLTSNGPVFFIQERPGKEKKIFKIYKFRSMKIGSEKMTRGQEVMKDDPRITRIGRLLRRFKLDEIPQFLNILKGDMSLVGPRPERISSLGDYNNEITKRLNMRPGITGLAQISGNIFLSLQERYKFDVYYVENYSFILDIKILFRTVVVIILGEEKFMKKKMIEVSEFGDSNLDCRKK